MKFGGNDMNAFFGKIHCWLYRHIDREDKVVYTFAKRALSQDTFNINHKECEDFANERSEKWIQKMYMLLLEELENKYL